MRRIVYNVSEIEPYINWLYFYHAWGLSGKPREEKEKLKAEALDMLHLHTMVIQKQIELLSQWVQ